MKYILLYSLLIQVYSQHSHDSNIFSGVYNPTVKHGLETYSGAWFMPRQLFLTKKDRIDHIQQLEMTTTSLVEDTDYAIMTRDYFDFQVEHLSSLTNQIDGNNPDVNEYLLNISSSKAEALRKYALHVVSSNESVHYFRENTVAVIPFSCTGAYMDSRSKQQNLREQYFLLTFWSIYRYFPHIVVSVTKKSDEEALERLDLPYFDKVVTSISTDDKSPKWLNPKQSLQYTYDQMKNNKDWNKFQFVYFSESDLVLHMRAQKNLYDVLYRNILNYDKHNNVNELFSLCPHRMQTLPLPKAFPEHVNRHIEAWRHEDLKDVNLLVEQSRHTHGSCCDNGRFIFRDCHNWWYNCKGHGLKNCTTWIQFSKFGYPMPLTTEHKGRCEYSATKIMCPVPDDCKDRMAASREELCREIPNIEKYVDY